MEDSGHCVSRCAAVALLLRVNFLPSIVIPTGLILGHFPFPGLQIKELNSQRYEVIMVTSGAVGLGRQRLRYRKLVNSRLVFAPFYHN